MASVSFATGAWHTLGRDFPPSVPRNVGAVRGDCRSRTSRSPHRVVGAARLRRPPPATGRRRRADRGRRTPARPRQRRPLDGSRHRRRNYAWASAASRRPHVADRSREARAPSLARRPQRDAPHPRRRVGARLRRSRVARLGARSRDAVVLSRRTTDRSRTRTACARARARSASGRSIPQGVSLWADVRSGGVGVQLGDRDARRLRRRVPRRTRRRESAFAALHAFCRQMCPEAPAPPPRQPVYGSNDWYWAYGKNSADTVRADAAHIVELSPTGENRPFA